MMNALRVVSLFLGYGLIGFGGDYAIGLWAQNVDQAYEDVRVFEYVEVEVAVDVADVAVEVDIEDVFVEVDVEVDVDVAVDPVMVDVRVRHGGSCSYELDRSFTIPVSGANLLVIDAGSGELNVEGRRGMDQIEVAARVCASREEWLDALTLSVEEVGSEILLEAHYPENRESRRGDNTAKIDLTVVISLGMDVDMDDSSGSLSVLGSGSLRVEDSSGSIRISGANGSVYVDDSSGGIEIRDVAGDVDVRDGSGEVDVSDVEGTVRVSDGSGGIDLAEVGQDVILESDGSGSIEVRAVGGDFVVRRDGSGGVRHSDVEGTVEIPEDKCRRRRRGN